MSERSEVRLSVTELASFACRTGDLERDTPVGPSAREGQRAHLVVQKACKARDLHARTEVTVSCTTRLDGLSVRLSGRVDLLNEPRHELIEIKSTLVAPEHLSDGQRQLHRAQLRLYGYCYLQGLPELEEPQERPRVRLGVLYINLRSGEQDVQWLEEEAADVIQFARRAQDDYRRWLDIVSVAEARTRESAGLALFPFRHMRDGQRHMATAVYRSARHGTALMVEAPTGTGKTVSALFPALKAIGAGLISQAGYLTAKRSAQQAALDTLQQMIGHGLYVRALVLRPKQAACFCSNGRCERDEQGRCPMTLGFFDRLPAAREEAMALGLLDARQLDELAWQHQLCPYELALQCLPWVSVFVADYNYVFDPLVRLAHFSGARYDTQLLIDEAHNLPQRARSMHSASLSRLVLLDAADSTRTASPVLTRALERLAGCLLKLGRGVQESQVLGELPGAPARLAGEAISAMIDGELVLSEARLDWFKSLCRYVAIAELFGDHHRCLVQVTRRDARREIRLTLLCLDASGHLQKQYLQMGGIAAFSATLRPMPWYRDTCGLPETTIGLTLDSPFEPDHACHLVMRGVSTRYRDRACSLDALCQTLHAVVSARSGNYLVFFSSYAYLRQSHEAFVMRYPRIETWCQQAEHSDADRNAALARLERPGTRLGFAILGGTLGEGVDYPGSRLIGAIVVGLGLPAPGIEHELLMERYREQGRDGYTEAGRLPGLTRVLQSAGRVIRTASDRGVVVLIDDRFGKRFYRALWPRHWRIECADNPEQVAGQLACFWQSATPSSSTGHPLPPLGNPG